MADNNLVAGDIPYPNIFHKKELPIKAAASTSYKKGEFVTNDADGYVIKLTNASSQAGKQRGIWQCLHAVDAPASGDGSVTMDVAGPGSRVLAHVQADAVAGRLMIFADEAGSGDTGTKNLEIAAASPDYMGFVVGRIWENYPKASKRKSAAGDLAVIDLLGV